MRNGYVDIMASLKALAGRTLSEAPIEHLFAMKEMFDSDGWSLFQMYHIQKEVAKALLAQSKSQGDQAQLVSAADFASGLAVFCEAIARELNKRKEA